MRGLVVGVALGALPAWAAEGEDVGEGGYDGGFVLRSADGDYALEIGGLIQANYAYESNLEQGDALEQGSAFSLARVRARLEGHVFGEELGYKIVTDFGKGGFVSLKDGYLDWTFAGRSALRVGQFKRPFSRQQLTGSSKLALIGRSVVDDAYGFGRDLGIMVHDGFARSPAFEVAAGVFNGTGDKPRFTGDVLVDPTTGAGEVTEAKLTNVPAVFHPMVVVRVGGNVGEKPKGYSEVDLEGGPPRFGLAGNALVDADADGGDDGQLLLGADYFFKAAGFGATGGYVFGLAQDGTRWTDQQAASMGFWQDVSYRIGKVAPAARYARFLPVGADNDVQEIAGGVNVLIHDHALKVQAMVGLLQEDTPTEPANVLLATTQLGLDF